MCEVGPDSWPKESASTISAVPPAHQREDQSETALAAILVYPIFLGFGMVLISLTEVRSTSPKGMTISLILLESTRNSPSETLTLNFLSSSRNSGRFSKSR